MTVDFRAAKGQAATFEELRWQAGQKGFDHLAEVYAAMKKEKADFKVEESGMYDWATELQGDGHPAEAVEVLKLNTVMYPDSGNAYETLGEAYEKAGQKPEAVESYKKALEKDPENADAKAKLKALEAK
jgi:tetratricopeptide (TPR) repeat protein